MCRTGGAVAGTPAHPAQVREVAGRGERGPVHFVLKVGLRQEAEHNDDFGAPAERVLQDRRRDELTVVLKVELVDGNLVLVEGFLLFLGLVRRQPVSSPAVNDRTGNVSSTSRSQQPIVLSMTLRTWGSLLSGTGANEASRVCMRTTSTYSSEATSRKRDEAARI